MKLRAIAIAKPAPTPNFLIDKGPGTTSGLVLHKLPNKPLFFLTGPQQATTNHNERHTRTGIRGMTVQIVRGIEKLAPVARFL